MSVTSPTPSASATPAAPPSPAPSPSGPAEPSASPPDSPSPSASPATTASVTPQAQDYQADARDLIRQCDAVDRTATDTARSIWRGTPPAQAAGAFRDQNATMQALQKRAGLLTPPPDQAARHQELLDVLALGVQRTAQLAEAANIEATQGVEAAKPHWETEIRTLEQYKQARKKLSGLDAVP